MNQPGPDARLRLSDAAVEVIQATPLALITMDPFGTVLTWNPAAEKLYGWNAGEVVGQPHPGVPSDKIGEYRALLRRVVQGETLSGFYVRRHRKDGTPIDLSVSASPIYGASGDVLGITSVALDITEQRRAESMLHDSEERFRSAFDDAAIGMAVVAINGHFIRVNPCLCQITGYAPHELLQMRTQDLTHPDDVPLQLDAVRRILDGDATSYQIEKRYRHRTGHDIWVLVSASLVRSALDEPLYFIAQIQDVSRRKAAEDALRESEERFRLTFDRAGAGIAHTDLDGRWLRANQSLCDLLGYSREELLQRRFHDVTHPDDLALDLALFRRLLAGEIPSYSMEKRYARKDGMIIWVNLSVSLVRENDGEPKYTIAVIENITDQRLTQEALRRSEQRYHDVVEMSPDAIRLLDGEGRILLANRGTAQMHGYDDADELVGMSVFNLIASEDRARARSDWTGPLREAALRDFDEPSAAEIARASHCAQYTMVRRDGSRFLAEVNTAAVHNAAGQPLVFSSVARNIDRRQEMERPRRRAGPRWLRPLPVELRER